MTKGKDRMKKRWTVSVTFDDGRKPTRITLRDTEAPLTMTVGGVYYFRASYTDRTAHYSSRDTRHP